MMLIKITGESVKFVRIKSIQGSFINMQKIAWQKIARPSPKLIECRSMKGFEKDCYLADLSKIPWDSAYIYDDIDDIYDHWHHLFIKVVDQHLPFKRKYIRGNQLPGITLEISSAISRRNILFRKFKRNKSDDNWEQFKKQRSLATPLKRKSMKSCFIQASAECAHPGEFRKEFKPLLPSKVLNNNIYDFQHFKQTFYRWCCCLSAHAFANHFSVNKISHRAVIFALKASSFQNGSQIF